MQHDFDRLYFCYSGFLFSKLDIPRKPVYFAFRLMPYLLGLFHWGACRVSKLGATSKNKSCKIDRIVWEMHAICEVLRFPFVTECTRGVPTAHSVRRRFRHNEWAVDTCIQPKTWHNMHFPYNLINFATFPFGRQPPIYSPCTRPSETTLTNKASIERQINRLSRDVKLEE